MSGVRNHYSWPRGTTRAMGETAAGFWGDRRRAVLGIFYMGGSVVSFAAGILEGPAELVAILGWVLATLGFYWAVHAVLHGDRFAGRSASDRSEPDS